MSWLKHRFVVLTLLSCLLWHWTPIPAHSHSAPSQMRIYLYAHGNPVNNTDPSGQFIGAAINAGMGLGQRVYAAGATFAATRPILAKIGGIAIGLFFASQVDTDGLQGIPGLQRIGALQRAEIRFLDAIKRGPIYRSLTSNLRGMINDTSGKAFQEFLKKNVLAGRLIDEEVPVRMVTGTNHRVDYEIIDDVLVEAKNAATVDTGQLRAFARYARETGKKLLYVFLRKPDQAVIRKVHDEGGNVGWFLEEID